MSSILSILKTICFDVKSEPEALGTFLSFVPLPLFYNCYNT